MTPRPVDLARLALGVWALARPLDVLHLVGTDDSTGPRRAARVLGARYVVQSAGGLIVERRRLSWVDSAVEIVHAASMLGAAAVFPSHRRLALTSGAVALVLAVADLSERVR
jgi:hypothetical protein